MADSKSKADRFKLLNRAELAALPELKWLMEGVFHERGVSVLYGDSNIGKTFVVIAIAAGISLGRSVFGQACDSGQVVIFAGEGEYGIHQRLAAWDAYYQEHAANVFVFTGRPALSDPEQTAAACLKLETAAIRPRLVVIDTLSTHFTGENENDTKDMTLFLEGAMTISERFGCHVIVVHHPKKNSDEPRGSGSVYNNTDTVAYLAKNQMSQLVLSCRKQKNAPLFADILIDLMPQVVVGDEEFSSLVAVAGASIELPSTGPAQSKHQLNVLKLLQAGPRRRGEIRDLAGIPEGSVDGVLDDLKKRGLIEKAGAQLRDPYRTTDAGKAIAISIP